MFLRDYLSSGEGICVYSRHLRPTHRCARPRSLGQHCVPERLECSLLLVTDLPWGVVQETQVPSLGPEDSLEEGMATHSSVLT